MEQRRRRPHPTRADQSRPSNHQTLSRSQIYCDLQWNSVAGAHTRPEPTKQPPDPLTEPDLLPFTMEQRRRRPHPTRADHSRPEPTRADQATTRPSNGVRSTAIYNGTASPAPTPDQSRPEPTTADQSRPSNHQTL